jgi:hypothetical protein
LDIQLITAIGTLTASAGIAWSVVASKFKALEIRFAVAESERKTSRNLLILKEDDGAKIHKRDRLPGIASRNSFAAASFFFMMILAGCDWTPSEDWAEIVYGSITDATHVELHMTGHPNTWDLRMMVFVYVYDDWETARSPGVWDPDYTMEADFSRIKGDDLGGKFRVRVTINKALQPGYVVRFYFNAPRMTGEYRAMYNP